MSEDLVSTVSSVSVGQRTDFKSSVVTINSEFRSHCNSSSCDFMDHKHADCYQKQNAEKHVKNFNSKESGISTFSENLLPSTCSTEIKIGDIDIVYEDIIRKTDEDKSSETIFCEMCNQRFGRETDFFKSTSYRSDCSCQNRTGYLFYNIQGEDMTFDVQPTSLDLTTDSGNEVTKEQDSSDIPMMISLPRMVNDNKMKRKLCPKTLQLNLSMTEKTIQCNFCPKFFSRVVDLKVHERRHTVENRLGCKVCFKSYASAMILRNHEKTHGEKSFHCKICPKTFTTSKYLKLHAGRVHMSDKPFKCKICPKSFSQKGNLKIHEVVHTSEKPFECKICSKSFSLMGTMKIHEKIHNSEKRFCCQICSKSYSRMDTLKVHVRDHTVEKASFQCKICSKSFSRMGTLKLHEKVHTGEKPFHCKICLKSFYTSNQLSNHEKIHGEKSHHCKFCSKSFSLKCNLTVHERLHTGEKPYGCKNCSKAFVSSNNLKAHTRIHTRKKLLHCKI